MVLLLLVLATITTITHGATVALSFPASTTSLKCGVNATSPASTATRLTSTALNLVQDGFLQMDVLLGSCSGSVSFDKTNFLRLRYQIGSNSPRDFASCSSSFCYELTRVKTVSRGLTNRGWQRVTYRLPSNYTNVQVVVDEISSSSTDWYIANAVFTTDCPQGCYGNGQCLPTGTCRCDEGFSNTTCLPTTVPTGLFEAFSGSIAWPALSGTSVAMDTSCYAMRTPALQVGFASSYDQEYFALTPMLDTQHVYHMSFYMSWSSSSSCGRSSFYSPSLYVTHDGGASFSLVNSYTSNGYVAVRLGSVARGFGTQFMWASSTLGKWAIDNVAIPKLRMGNMFALNYSQPDELLSLGIGSKQPFCGVDAFVPGTLPANGVQVFETHVLDVGNASSTVVEFKLAAGCNGLRSITSAMRTALVEVEVSTSQSSWRALNPNNLCTNQGDCSSWSQHLSDIPATRLVNGFVKFVYSIPSPPSDGRVQLRWRASSTGWSYAIKDVYVGNACPGMLGCSQHGSCITGRCVCDPDFLYDNETQTCLPKPTALPRELRESFEDDLAPALWSTPTGGVLENSASNCGEVVNGRAAVFRDYGSRTLITHDLDTRQATLLSYNIKQGVSTSSSSACRSPSSSSEGLSVGYSTDGGVTYNSLSAPSYSSYRYTPGYVNVLLPAAAKKAATRFMWFQSTLMSSTNRAAWAIDDIFVGYASSEVVHSLYPSAFPSSSTVLFAPTVTHSSYCSRSNASVTASGKGYILTRDIVATSVLQAPLSPTNVPSAFTRVQGGTSTTGPCGLSGVGFRFDQDVGSLPRQLETKNINASAPGLELSFLLSYGSNECDAPETGSGDELLRFEYSTNGGSSWKPWQTYSATSPTRKTFPLTGDLQTETLRLRWTQNDQDGTDDGWAIADLQVAGREETQAYLQFDYNVGCGDTDAVLAAEWSTTYGRSWSASDICNPIGSSSCQSWGEHAGGDLVGSASNTWQRATMVLPIADALRVRLRSEEGRVAVGNVYLGIDCPVGCSGHGRCSENGTCVCDTGYELSGQTCVAQLGTNPEYLVETFDSDAYPTEGRLLLSTGEVVSSAGACGPISAGSKQNFNNAGRRFLVTRDLNTTSARFVEFTFAMGQGTTSSTCNSPSSYTEGLAIGYSTNGGITYTLLASISYSTSYTAGGVEYRVNLPVAAQTSATRLMVRQPSEYNGFKNSDVWSIDSLYIGPPSNTPTSFAVTGGQVPGRDAYVNLANAQSAIMCGRPALRFTGAAGTQGEHVLSTVPITTSNESFTQLLFTTGCSAAPSGEFEVALEYLDSHSSATWSSLSTQSCDPTGSSCTSLSMASEFQSNDYAAGWHRVTFRLPRASNRRYRLVATSSSRTVQRTWGVSDWIVATDCPVVNNAPCGGFGFCNQSKCQCDTGFQLDVNGSCVAENSLRTFVEEFTGGLQQEVWQALPVGGKITSPPCGNLGEGTVYKFDGKYGRRLFTKALNTTGLSYLSSTILVGGISSVAGCDAIDSLYEGIVVMASINNGVTWQVLERYTSTSSYNEPQTQTIAADSRWQSDQTILAFWQPRHSFINADVWFLDSVHLGYARATPPTEARFAGSVFPTEHFSQVTNEIITSACGRSNVAAFSGDDEATVAIETVPLDLGNSSYIQLELSAGCTSVSSTNRFDIVFEQSDDLGETWSNVFASPCNPSTTSTCTSGLWYLERDLQSVDYAGWSRVTLPLPSVKAGRRYRVSAVDKSVRRLLYVSYVYLGNGCNNGFDVGCGQHGRCTANNTCACDAGYSVQDGLCRLTTQATTLKDEFKVSNSAGWLRQLGGVVEPSDCGTLAEGAAMHFENIGSRLIMTTDLDLRNGLDVFYILQMGDWSSSGACSDPSNSAEGTVLLYSLDSGVRWTVLTTHAYSSYRGPTRVRKPIPAVARRRGVKLMLIQPRHSSYVGSDEWAVDNFGVGSGILSQLPTELSYDFTTSGATIGNITFAPNAAIGSCARQTALLLSGSATFKSIETDLMLVNDSHTFLQLDISTGCSSTFPSTFEVEPRFTLVGSDYEYNIGVPCTSACSSWRGQATADYLGASLSRFRRIAIPIGPNSQARRFRIQLRDTLNSYQLGIKAMYIGHACDYNCHGYGMCTPGGCKCDRGFTRTADGRGCVYDTVLSELRDDFDDEIFADRWPVAMGGTQRFEGGSCGHQSSGFAYVLDEPGLRWLESTDLDLLAAEFVQYQMYSSTSSSTSGCRAPSSSEGMSLGYSVDFGRTWTLIDYSSLYSAKTVIATLPAAAKTNHTRLVLWQRSHTDFSGYDVIALDDFYVGPDSNGVLSALQDNFDNIDETQFLNIDGGDVRSYCTSTGKALVMSDSSIDELLVTTQDVDMQPGELVLLNQPLSATPDVNYVVVSGAADDVSKPCGLSDGLIFDLKVPRRLETKDFVVSSTGLKLTFQLAMDAGGCDGPEIENGETVTLHYSTDSGVSWVLLQTYAASSSPTVDLDRLGSGSSKKLRFRWQQLKFDNRTIGFDAWAIDNIQIRGFPQYQYYLQFKVRTSCLRASTNEVQVRLSTTRTSFTRFSSCSPMSSTACEESGELPNGEINSFQAPYWRRFTLSLGINPGSRLRVQWQQSKGGDFALDDIYFGRGCPDMCNNQGACQLSGLCVCDTGFKGPSCAESTTPLPSYFSATHSEAESPWALTTGITRTGCLTGAAMYFSRFIVNEALTPPLDTSQAFYLSYDWKNCASTATYTSFIVACSTNGGLTWQRLVSHLNQYRGASGSKNLTLPVACRAPVTQFKFYAGTSRSYYWAIDNVNVGGICSASSCAGDQVCTPTNASSYTCACPGSLVATANGTCVTQVCNASTACPSTKTCHEGFCNPATGCEERALTGVLCDDGDATTINDSCQAGVCMGTSRCANVACSSGAQCLTAQCNPMTGTCEETPKANGTTCNDGRNATVNDACQSGVCVGQDNLCLGKTCSASQCQTNGVCQPATGICSFDNVADSTTCDDGLDTTVSECFNGTCVGTSKCANVNCGGSQCYSTRCIATTGLCTREVLTGEACNDGNSSTSNDICLQDGTCRGIQSCDDIVCFRRSQCHSVGTCQAGVCSNPILEDGSDCDDGNPQTADSCLAGVCVGVDLCANVTCSSQNECAESVCDVQSGQCVEVSKPNNSVCSTGVCIDAVCKATTSPCNTSTCPTPANPCQVAACINDQCGFENSSDTASCSLNGNTGSCSYGVCVVPDDKCLGVTCSAPSQCQSSNTCDSVSGQCVPAFKSRGTACNDNDVSTTNDVCDGRGGCQGMTDPCLSVSCTNSSCQTTTGCLQGVCQYITHTGRTCDDGSDATVNDVCDASGACLGVDACTLIPCEVEPCRSTAICLAGQCFQGQALPDDTQCDDNNPATRDDKCVQGACIGVMPVTTPASTTTKEPTTVATTTTKDRNAPDASGSNDSSDSDQTMIIAIAAGAAVLIGLCCFIGACCYVRRNKNQDKAVLAPSTNTAFANPTYAAGRAAEAVPPIYDNSFGGEPQVATDYNDGEVMYDVIDGQAGQAGQPDFSEPFTVLDARNVDDVDGYNEAEA
eukprot:m.289284 g.289284  ORF g.289284 m.289284 type:complete len:3539 (+) comp17796_c0_seq1:93-10709(+)